MQSTKEKKTIAIYNDILNTVLYPKLGRGITWTSDLNKIGHEMFGDNFVGSFPSDMIPDIGKNLDGSIITNKNINKNSKLYSLINLDNSSQPGSHWIAIGYNIPKKKNKGEIWVYDSFGRKTSNIIPSLSKKFGSKLRTADRDPEQKITEEDCGARSLAFLFIMDRVGIEFAKLL